MNNVVIKLVNKLRMLGMTEIEYNSFMIRYKPFNSEGFTLLRYYDNGHTKLVARDIHIVTLRKYFVEIQMLPNGGTTVYTEDSIVPKLINLSGYVSYGTNHDNTDYNYDYDSSDIMMIVTPNDLHILNRYGDKAVFTEFYDDSGKSDKSTIYWLEINKNNSKYYSLMASGPVLGARCVAVLSNKLNKIEIKQV